MKYLKSFQDFIYQPIVEVKMKVVCIGTPFKLFQSEDITKSYIYYAGNIASDDTKYLIYSLSGSDDDTAVSEYVGRYDKKYFEEYNTYMRDKKIKTILDE